MRWLTTLLAVGALMAIGAQSGIASTRPLTTGISGLADYDPLALEHVKATGAQLVHITISWASVAPRKEPSSWQPDDPADPNYNWARTDLAVTNAVGAELTPVLLVDGAPLWAQRCRAPTAVAGRPCDPDPAALAAFATAAARRYSGSFQGLPRVQYWQGQNEPNLSLFLSPQFEGGKPVSPTLYRRLINAFYFAVKAVDGSNLVLAAGLGPIEVKPSTIGPMRFARSLLCMAGRRNPHPTPGDCEGGVHFDIFDIHPYTTGGPTHKGHVDDVELGDLAKLQELLSAADRAGRIHGQFRRTPLWITEFSWDSKPPDPGGLQMGIETRWVAQALYQAWSAGISHFFWFSLRDSLADELIFGTSLQSGLYFRGSTIAEDKPKKVMSAFRFPFVAFPIAGGGISFWGRTGTSTGGRVKIQIQDHGSWRTASVARAAKDGIFDGTIPTTYGSNGRGSVRALYRNERAIPFSLKKVPDFHQPPFGS